MIFIILGFIVAIIDSSLGMLYGTLLSPILLFFFDPKVSIPAVLLSQGIGGITACIFHHKYDNADFSIKRSSDIKHVLQIMIPGLFAILIGVFFVIKLNPVFIKTYIAILIVSIGVFLVKDKKISFSNQKMFLIGFIGTFNKIISGGGFGPLVTGGQILIGVTPEKAIAVEAFSKIPICIISFLLYTRVNEIVHSDLIIFLSIGAFLGSIIGPWLTSSSRIIVIQKIIGYIIILLGFLLILNLTGNIKINI